MASVWPAPRARPAPRHRSHADGACRLGRAVTSHQSAPPVMEQLDAWPVLLLHRSLRCKGERPRPPYPLDARPGLSSSGRTAESLVLAVLLRPAGCSPGLFLIPATDLGRRHGRREHDETEKGTLAAEMRGQRGTQAARPLQKRSDRDLKLFSQNKPALENDLRAHCVRSVALRALMRITDLLHGIAVNVLRRVVDANCAVAASAHDGHAICFGAPVGPPDRLQTARD